MGKAAKKRKNGTGPKVKPKTFAEAEREVAMESGLSVAATKKLVKAHKRESDLTEEENRRFTDLNMNVAVLCNILVGKMEELEEYGLLYGDVKFSVKNAGGKLEKFITKAFSVAEETEGEGAKTAASNGVMVVQDRVEHALLNQYVLTVDERRDRCRETLKEHVGKTGYKKELLEKMVEDIMWDLQFNKNAFNF